jgi:hypothetical protein
MQEWITILDLREQTIYSWLKQQEGTASRQQNPSGKNKNVWQKFYKKNRCLKKAAIILKGKIYIGVGTPRHAYSL